MKFLLLFSLIVCPMLSFSQSSQDSTKQDYTLFHPTPKSQMRGFETDRPDLTESAYTVDAGHFQFETDLFITEHYSANELKTIQNSYNVFNVKLGLTNGLDIQLVAESFVDESATGTNSSFGMITIRAKQNIWGNDQGKTALAILPFVNIPTLSSQKITGGLVLPLGMSLPNDWGFGTQFETDFVDNQTGNGYHLNISGSATFAHSLVRNLDFFIETLVSRENELKNTEYFLNGGLVLKVSENVKLDTGFNYGLKDSSPNIYFVGLSFRI